MSSELNKIFCAILSAILVYLLASFLSELLYNVDKKKVTKLSYNIENVEDKNKNPNEVNVESELKIITELELNMPIKNKIGPSLAIILDRKIGNLSDYKYSKTLLNIDKKWNIVNLYYFLEKPKEWAPGTKMSYRGISDSQKLLNTIKYLRENSISNEN